MKANMKIYLRKTVVKDEPVSEEVMLLINFTLKELPEMLQYIDSTKNKILEADPNLQKNMRISQSTEKLVIPYCKFCNKKASTIQTICDMFLTNT